MFLVHHMQTRSCPMYKNSNRWLLAAVHGISPVPCLWVRRAMLWSVQHGSIKSVLRLLAMCCQHILAYSVLALHIGKYASWRTFYQLPLTLYVVCCFMNFSKNFSSGDTSFDLKIYRKSKKLFFTFLYTIPFFEDTFGKYFLTNIL